MRELTREERHILKEHKKWLKGEGGKRADFSEADLSNANLRWADLRWADLFNADLFNADLSNANLAGADLSETDLSNANLQGADLSNTNLQGADLSNANLYRAKGILSIGSIGSRYDLTRAFVCKGEVYVECGCFFGTLDEFSKKVKKTHGESSFGKEYKATIALIKTWASIHFGIKG